MPNGILIVDKPQDWTSMDVCAKLRGVLGEKRIGHAGTLDPMATGVLTVFVGRATRAVEFASGADKEYLAEIQLGVITNTQDIWGEVLERRPVTVGRQELEALLPQFTGELEQVPPMYSAVKIQGKKLYELARKGQEVERKARHITIHALELLENGPARCPATDGPARCPAPTEGPARCPAPTEGPAGCPAPTGGPAGCPAPTGGPAGCPAPTGGLVGCPAPTDTYSLRVRCSKGTYIRTLCHDIGQALGCGGCMASLRRTVACGFSLSDAHPLEEVVAHPDPASLLLPVDRLFSDRPSLRLKEQGEKKVRNGASLSAPKLKEGKYRLYGETGEFLALGQCKNGKLTVVKSFFDV